MINVKGYENASTWERPQVDLVSCLLSVVLCLVAIIMRILIVLMARLIMNITDHVILWTLTMKSAFTHYVIVHSDGFQDLMSNLVAACLSWSECSLLDEPSIKSSWTQWLSDRGPKFWIDQMSIGHAEGSALWRATQTGRWAPIIKYWRPICGRQINYKKEKMNGIFPALSKLKQSFCTISKSNIIQANLAKKIPEWYPLNIPG